MTGEASARIATPIFESARGQTTPDWRLPPPRLSRRLASQSLLDASPLFDRLRTAHRGRRTEGKVPVTAQLLAAQDGTDPNLLAQVQSALEEAGVEALGRSDPRSLLYGALFGTLHRRPAGVDRGLVGAVTAVDPPAVANVVRDLAALASDIPEGRALFEALAREVVAAVREAVLSVNVALAELDGTDTVPEGWS